MTLAFVIAVLIFTDNIALWHVLAMAFARGLAASVKITVIRTLVLDVVGRANLLAANAATLAADETMGIIVPTLAGLIIERLDIAWAYVLMGCAGLAAAVMLLTLGRVEIQGRTDRSTTFQDLRAGLRFAGSNRVVRSLLILGLVGEVFGWGHYSMLPVMARDVLEVGPVGLGLLASAGSVGALAASLVMSARGDVDGKSRLMASTLIGFGGFLLLFAWSKSFIASVLILATAHFLGAVSFIILDTLLQTTVPGHMRGRVLSIQSFGFGLSDTTGFQRGRSLDSWVPRLPSPSERGS